jgi:hypothetical protein
MSKPLIRFSLLTSIAMCIAIGSMTAAYAQDLPPAAHVPAETLKALVGKYDMQAPPGMQPPPGPPLEITADDQGLEINVGEIHKLRPISATEFIDEQAPGNHHLFSKDEKGRTIMTVTGLGPEPLIAIKEP